MLPILLTTVMGALAAVVGLMEGVAQGGAATMKFLADRWSDRFGRRPAVAGGRPGRAREVVIVAATVLPCRRRERRGVGDVRQQAEAQPGC